LQDREDQLFLSSLKPLNPYGWSKHITDRILLQRVDSNHPKPPQWCALKFFNVYGPNEYHKDDMQSVVAKFFLDIRANKTIKLFKSYRSDIPDGHQSRDFIYVKDCTSVILWLIQNADISGVYNVGTGVASSFKDFIEAVAVSLNTTIDISFVPMPLHLRDKYQYHTIADMSKLRAVGYLKSFASVGEGVNDYVLNYLAAADPYR